MTASLSAEQTELFWTEGCVYPVRGLPREDALAARAHLLGLMRDPDLDIPKPFADYARTCFHIVSTEAARLAAHPAVLDAVESILGPDLLVWGVELIVKPAHSDKILTMHQDLNYWGFDHADQEVTAWLALGDVVPAQGSMQWVRGSHRRGHVPHHDTYGEQNLLSRGQEVAVEFDPDDVDTMTLAAGEFSLHHGLTFHGSGPNTTDDDRVGLVVRYITPDMGKAGGTTDYAMLVRGVDRTNNLVKVAPPTTDFGPVEIALHAEIEAAQLVDLADGASDAFGYTRG